MNLKGTRTEQNLLAAFSGESMARNKYLFFAEKARQEGHQEIAELFEAMAQNEGVHGRLLLQQLSGIGSSAANLQQAIQGEYGEWSSMYPSFAQVAREEGFEEIGTLFDQISKIEKDHEFRFLTAFSKLMSQNQAAPQAVEQKKERPHTVTIHGYRCIFCGATFEKCPDVCPVCQAIGAFEPTTFEKQVD